MSSQAKLLEMQMQIRQNSIELYDYLHDLDKWESDIKTQDEDFSEINQRQNDQMLQDTDSEDEQMKLKKISYDYEKLSLFHKNKGNEHFKAKRYDRSIEYYTKAMKCDPTNSILPANRAMAYLKLKRYAEAEADCTFSLSLNSCYVKSYLRRGHARNALGKVEDAIKDFHNVLQLEPDNKQAKQEINAVMHKDHLKKATFHNVSLTTQSTKKFVLPCNKPTHLQSKKPLKRINVVEVKRSLTESPLKSFDTSINCNIPFLSNKLATSEFKNKEISIPSIPSPPATCFQLLADIRTLKPHSCALLTYLMQLDVKQFPSMIKDQLDSDMLLTLINCFTECVASTNIEFILQFLENLVKAKRFDMALLFLSNNNKRDLCVLREKLLQKSTNHIKIIKMFSAYTV